MKLKYKAYPDFVKAVKERHLMYNDTLDYIAKREGEGKLFVIAPPEDLPVGKIEKDPEVLKKAYDIGREATMSRLADIKGFLEE